MKQKIKEKAKYWLKLFLWSMVGVTLANLLVHGMPFFDMPKEDEVVSAVVSIDGMERQVNEEDTRLAVLLAGGLRHKGRTEVADMPSAIITYELTDGSRVTIGADKDVILYKGRFYRTKDPSGGFFEKVAISIYDEWN